MVIVVILDQSYEDISKYQEAKREYVAWRKLAHDDLAVVLRMKVDAGQKVRLLETRSYEIVIED